MGHKAWECRKGIQEVAQGERGENGNGDGEADETKLVENVSRSDGAADNCWTLSQVKLSNRFAELPVTKEEQWPAPSSGEAEVVIHKP